MIPAYIAGTPVNLHKERAEGAGIVDDAFILPTTPVHAEAVTGSMPVLPIRHRHRQTVSSTVRGVLICSVIAVLADVGLVMGLLAGLEAIERAQ